MASKPATILLKILEKIPDGNKVGLLLEPNNLLKLLQIYGQSQDDIRPKLANGTLPGELLLELLEREPDADRLLAQLGVTEITPTPKITTQDRPIKFDKTYSSPIPKATPPIISQDKPVMASNTKSEQSRNLFGNYFFVVSIVIITFTVLIPALIITGFISGQEPSRETGMIIALIGGGIAGAIANPWARFSWKGLFIGMVYGISTLWATIWYTQARTSIFNIEIMIPLLLGVIPAFAIYFLLSRIFPANKSDATQDP